MSKLIATAENTEYKKLMFPAIDDIAGVAPREAGARVQTIPTASRLEQIERQAYHDGFERGHREGIEAGETAANELLGHLSRIISTLSSPLAGLDGRVEQELVALALAIARQIVRRELKVDPGQVVAVIREAVATLPVASARIRLYLHPEDAVLVRQVLRSADGETNWQVFEDPGLARGGCRMETDLSRIDASVEARIAAIAAAIFGGERDDDTTA